MRVGGGPHADLMRFFEGCSPSRRATVRPHDDAEHRRGQHVAEVVLVLLDAGEPDAGGQPGTPAPRLPAVVLVGDGGQAEGGRRVPGGKRQAVASRPGAFAGRSTSRCSCRRRSRSLPGRSRTWPSGSGPGGRSGRPRTSRRRAAPWRLPPAVAPVLPQVSQVPWRRPCVRESNAEAETVAADADGEGQQVLAGEDTHEVAAEVLRESAHRPPTVAPAGCRRGVGSRTTSGRAGPCRPPGVLDQAGEGRRRQSHRRRHDRPSPRASSPRPSCRRLSSGSES